MHFGDYTFIVILALVLFGPKRLPEIARQAGRLMMEFRRASNEFKMQMEEELRNFEEEERRKELEQAAASTGTIAEPHALPDGASQSAALASSEEAEEAQTPQPYTPPLPDEECVDPVDLLDSPQSHAEELYEEEEYSDELQTTADEVPAEATTEADGPEISGDSQPPASYHPSAGSTAAPESAEQPEQEQQQHPVTPQDPVRPESDPAIHHA